MSFVAEAQAYAKFLEIDKQVPRNLGVWIGGFMMMAHDRLFFEDPYIWSYRVYFTPWSQNRRPAISPVQGKAFFCPERRSVFGSMGHDVIPIFDRAWHRSLFSGAMTRRTFDEGREGFRWLSAQLG